VYEIHVRTCHLILIEEITLILDNMNVLGTSEINVLSAGKINTLSSVYALFHTSFIFSLILLWEEMHLKLSLTLLLK